MNNCDDQQKKQEFDIQVSGNLDTVWTTAADGSCVGRFSKRFGIDVHTTMSEQLEGASQCLFCTHSPTSSDDWETFRRLMSHHYAIPVPQDLIKF